jgi:hypothetical protein
MMNSAGLKDNGYHKKKSRLYRDFFNLWVMIYELWLISRIDIYNNS